MGLVGVPTIWVSSGWGKVSDVDGAILISAAAVAALFLDRKRRWLDQGIHRTASLAVVFFGGSKESIVSG